MEKSKTFTVADLSLRDCWKICKDVSLSLIFIGIIYGIVYLFSWGYESGSESLFGSEPIGSFWGAIPKWVRFGIIFVLAFLILRGLVSQFLIEIAEIVERFGRWLGRASFKVRLAMVITLTVLNVLFIYTPYVGFGVTILVASVVGSYQDLKEKKIRKMEDEL